MNRRELAEQRQRELLRTERRDRQIKVITLTDLSKVTKPGARRAQAKYKVVGRKRGERTRVIDEVRNDRLSGLMSYVIEPRVAQEQTVLVRWSYLTRGGMTPWVKVTRDRSHDFVPTLVNSYDEEDIAFKDARDIMHIVPAGYDSTTRCGLDTGYSSMLSIAMDAKLDHCWKCWAGREG